MAKDLDILLQPKQATLLDLLETTGPEAVTRLGWGGARGAAKSGGLRRIAMVLASTYKQVVIVIVRKHFGDLVENHVEKMRLEYPEFHSRYYRQSDAEWRLDNGSRITLAYGDTPKDIQEFARGPEFTFLFVDQAEQFTEAELVDLTIPNRWPGARQRFAKSVFFFNPGGPGTEYLRRVFHVREFKVNESPADWSFIQAYGWDNYEWFRGEVNIDFDAFYDIPGEPPVLDGALLENKCTGEWPNCLCYTRFEIFVNHTSEGRKMRGLDPSKRLGELFGSFDKFSGQYYASVWDEQTCVLPVSLAERIIQPWWTRWCSQDWGFAHNNVVLWFATGKLSPSQSGVLGVNTEWPVDIIICYREYVCVETGEEDVARNVVAMTPSTERKGISGYWLSPDAWAKRGSADAVAEQLGRVLTAHGIHYPEQADNDRIGGWALLRNCFQRCMWRKGGEVEQKAAASGPMLLMSSACPSGIQSIPMLTRDDKNPEDVLKVDTLSDDWADCLRYGIKSQLDPRSKAPRSVREVELYQSIEDPTARMIEMRKFAIKESGKILVRRARGR